MDKPELCQEEWVPADEAKPEISPRYARLSDNVYLLLKDGTTEVGYYNYRDYQWHREDCKQIEPGTVAAWQSKQIKQ